MQYGLTNSEFDRADKLIFSKPFLSQRAGVERPLTEIDKETIAILFFALVAWPQDDLLDESKWAGLRGIVEVMRAVGAPEDYEHQVAKFLHGRSSGDCGDIARAILRRPDLFIRALGAMGQATLLDAGINTGAAGTAIDSGRVGLAGLRRAALLTAKHRE